LAITACGKRVSVIIIRLQRCEQRFHFLHAAHGPQLLEVVARAESAPLRREHDDADAGIGRHAVERRLRLVDERTRERVELAGTIERQRGDAVRRFDEQQALGLGPWCSLSWQCPSVQCLRT
jgi:hypothetical protein